MFMNAHLKDGSGSQYRLLHAATVQPLVAERRQVMQEQVRALCLPASRLPRYHYTLVTLSPQHGVKRGIRYGKYVWWQLT